MPQAQNQKWVTQNRKKYMGDRLHSKRREHTARRQMFPHKCICAHRGLSVKIARQGRASKGVHLRFHAPPILRGCAESALLRDRDPSMNTLWPFFFRVCSFQYTSTIPLFGVRALRHTRGVHVKIARQVFWTDRSRGQPSLNPPWWFS